MQEKQVKVSACIVTYNNCVQVMQTIKGILDHTKGVPFQLYVSDNGSTDDTVKKIHEEFPAVIVLENKHNGGFGWGHNQVLPHLNSEYHAIINPDILLEEDSLSKLAGFLDENQDVVLCCPKIVNSDQTEQFLPKKIPTVRYLMGGRLERFGGVFKKWRDDYTLRNVELPDVSDIQFCTGCFMFVRTDALKAAGGFDDRYFMYFEDADLTRQLMQTGRVVRTNATEVVHLWQRDSAKKVKFLFIQLQSMMKYFHKWR